jgi:predicted nucleic-acid-binding Zn-ribbon protein
MATSTCIKCGAHSFEIKVKEPTGSAVKLVFVQCSACGGVVGVTEFFSNGALIHKLAKKLGVTL